MRGRLRRVLEFCSAERTVLVALCCFAFVNTFAWSLITPVEYGGDERAYMDVVRFLEQEHRVPRFAVDEGMGVEAVSVDPRLPPYPYRSYADRPGLPFLLSATVMSMGATSAWADNQQARLPGSLYAALFVLLCFLAARALVPSRSPAVAVGVACAAAFWPQVTAMFSVVNDDGLTILAVAGVVWSWLRGARLGWATGACVQLGAFMSLLLLAKPSGYVLVALTALVALVSLRGTWMFIASRLGLVVATILVLAGWRYAIAVHMYGLDIFNSALTQELIDRLDATTHPARDYMSFWEMIRGDTTDQAYAGIGPTLPTLLTTFFGNFTHQQYRLGGVATGTVVAFVTVAVAELVLRAVDLRFEQVRRVLRSPVGRVQVLVFLTIPLLFGLVVWRIYTVDFIPAGQYAFPALPAVLVALVVGLHSFGRTRRGRRVLLGAFSLVLLACNRAGIEIVDRELGRTQIFDGQWQSAYWQIWTILSFVVAALVLVYWMRAPVSDDAIAAHASDDPRGEDG